MILGRGTGSHTTSDFRVTYRRAFLRSLACLVITLSFVLALTVVTAQPAYAAGCFTGARKFIYKEKNGNQHHIVEFNVNLSTTDDKWYIAGKPRNFSFSSSVWPRYYNGSKKWVGYQWPYNWWDPYSASDWRLCYR